MKNDRYTFFDVGFHGDLHLSRVVDEELRNSKYFVETGTNVGSTLCYVAKLYPHLTCFSCEPNSIAFRYASQNVERVSASNVHLFNQKSDLFLAYIVSKLANKEVGSLFWLDSHGGGFEWPLRAEIKTITDTFEHAGILVDDFKVPGKPCFKYSSYDGQEGSMKYIKEAMNPTRNYRIQYPLYTEKTSTFHPLTGWVLIRY